MISQSCLRLSGRIRSLFYSIKLRYPTNKFPTNGNQHLSLSSAYSSAPTHRPLVTTTQRRPLLVYLALGCGLVYVVDNQWYSSSVTRTLRTFAVGVVVASDYKINFRPHPPFANSIEELHARNSERIYNLLRANGGLYLKIGQAIAMQSAVLPPEFQKRFAKFFDDAPQDDWESVKSVVEEDFGRPVEQVFGVTVDGERGGGRGVMEKTAQASASVAQVHWARLDDGREVAIKVQKRDIRQQVNWDLWAFGVIMYAYTKMFDLPLYQMVPYISQRLLLETDFVNEANNAETMACLIANEPRLRGRVYIPKVYRELSSRRVLTAEWIEGVRLWDKDLLTLPWKGGEGGSPGAGGKPISIEPVSSKSNVSSDVHPLPATTKPERTSWRGPLRDGGLGVHLSDVMSTIVDLFSAQMFLWGVVHCDPHPGNIFVRRLPSGKPEVVLIDHGLYISMDPRFKSDWGRLWVGLLTFDNDSIRTISSKWGIRNSDAFASSVLMRPYTGGDMSTQRSILDALDGLDDAERAFALQERMRGALREILADEEKWPRELIFLARNLRIVQGNNQFLGSPVNRLKITAIWASRAISIEERNRKVGRSGGVWNWASALGRHVLFRLTLFSSDIIWWVSRVRQVLGLGGGMEEDVEAKMREIAKSAFGVELNHDLFDG